MTLIIPTIMVKCPGCQDLYKELKSYAGHCSIACRDSATPLTLCACEACGKDVKAFHSGFLSLGVKRYCADCSPIQHAKVQNDMYEAWVNSLSPEVYTSLKNRVIHKDPDGGYYFEQVRISGYHPFNHSYITEAYRGKLVAHWIGQMNAETKGQRRGIQLSFRSNATRMQRMFLNTPIGSDFKAITQMFLDSPDGYHTDHIYPLSKGGLHCLSNLHYLDAETNIAKANMLPKDWAIMKDHWKNAHTLGIRKPDLLASLIQNRAKHKELQA